MSPRSGSKRSGFSKRFGSRFPEARISHRDAPLGMVTPATSMSERVVRWGSSCTGGSYRSSSSTMGTDRPGSSRSRWRTSGWRSRVSMPLVIRLTVVSWPAISSSAEVLRASMVVIAPSGPSAVASWDSMSSPGFLRRSSISPARYMPSSMRASIAPLPCWVGSASGSGSRLAARVSAQTWKRGSSSWGTPSSRQMTVTGKGYANWSTRSTRSRLPVVAMPSINPETRPPSSSRMSCTRRGECGGPNGRFVIRRKRSWSGGSSLRKDGGKVVPSSSADCPSGSSPVAFRLRASELIRGSCSRLWIS